MEMRRAIPYTSGSLILKQFILKQRKKYFIYTSQKNKAFDLFYSYIQHFLNLIIRTIPLAILRYC
jgi:hypothetical protein